jgi:hypothetical protein
MHVPRPAALAPMALFKCQLFDVMSSVSTLQDDFFYLEFNSLTSATFPLPVGKEFMPPKQFHVSEVSLALNVFCPEAGLSFVLVEGPGECDASLAYT